jgi:hypothetical protein
MKDVKDKRILVQGLVFAAEVHWYDGTVTSAGLHATLKAAQKALAMYPDDVFDGYDNPSSDRATAHMETVRKENKVVFHTRPRRKELPNYERLYDRRVR